MSPAQSEVVDRSEHVIGWGVEDDSMARTSHAIGVDGAVYLVDPVEVSDLEELVEPLGTIAGVVLTLDRHRRDAAAIANHFEVPVLVPDSFSDVTLDASVQRIHDRIPETPIEIRGLIENRFWQEVVLWWGEHGILYVPEAVGTARFFRAGDERLGVHPMLRLTPPRRLASFSPETLLVGHGPGLEGDATPALETALRTARRRAPRLLLDILTSRLP